MIKKTIITFLLSIMLVAITSGSNKFGFGIYGGANLSTIYFNDSFHKKYMDTKYKLGYQFGLSFSAAITKRISLLFEPGFISKGMKYKIPPYNESNSYTLLNYLDLPLIGSFKISIKSNICLILGVNNSFLVFSDNDKEKQKHDFGLQCGISKDFLNLFNVSFSYIHGLRMISDSQYCTFNNESPKVNSYNRSIQLNIKMKIF